MLTADTNWFEIALDGDTNFSVYAFTGEEHICEPYEFCVDMVHLSDRVNLREYVGKNAVLTLNDKFGVSRHVHGIVRSMEQRESTNTFTHYRCRVVPRLWFLGRNRNHRIFQNKSVQDIIWEILTAQQGFDGNSVEFRLLRAGKKALEYVAQYGESDLHFLSRITEESGIYFFFEHSDTAHKLVFSDLPGGPPLPGQDNFRFYSGSGQAAESSVINRLKFGQNTGSSVASYRDWNFTRPDLKSLAVTRDGTNDRFALPPAGVDTEVYQYPHLYQLKETGTDYAELQVQRMICSQQWIECETDAVNFVPGFTFLMNSHPRTSLNGMEWTLLSVRQQGEQPQVLQHEAPERGFSYKAEFRAIPGKTRYVPPLRHPRRRILGNQPAFVTGPEGEEIYPDKYGRVKVQFLWDRLDQFNEKSSCWVRAAQGWAGSRYGMIAIPRVGQEVLISYLEGDPDRPLITGHVYNAGQMPPYELPENKTRSVFKSLSTPGPKDEKRGFNELRIEDKATVEEIFIQAEKDVNTHTKNDWKDKVLGNRHRSVGGDTFANTGGETHETLQKPRKTELFADDNRTVHADSHFKYDGKWLGKVGNEIHLKSGMKMVIEAGTEITVKAGGSYIKIDPSGVSADGVRVDVNGSGAPSAGRGAAPQLPADATAPGPSGKPKHVVQDLADPAQDAAAEGAAQQDLPVCLECLRNAATAGQGTTKLDQGDV